MTEDDEREDVDEDAQRKAYRLRKRKPDDPVPPVDLGLGIRRALSLGACMKAADLALALGAKLDDVGAVVRQVERWLWDHPDLVDYNGSGWVWRQGAQLRVVAAAPPAPAPAPGSARDASFEGMYRSEKRHRTALEAEIVALRAELVDLRARLGEPSSPAATPPLSRIPDPAKTQSSQSERTDSRAPKKVDYLAVIASLGAPATIAEIATAAGVSQPAVRFFMRTHPDLVRVSGVPQRVSLVERRTA